MSKHTNTPHENLLLVIALAAEHVQHGRYSYAVTALSVAMELANSIVSELANRQAGEEELGQGATLCPNCQHRLTPDGRYCYFCGHGNTKAAVAGG